MLLVSTDTSTNSCKIETFCYHSFSTFVTVADYSNMFLDHLRERSVCICCIQCGALCIHSKISHQPCEWLL